VSHPIGVERHSSLIDDLDGVDEFRVIWASSIPVRIANLHHSHVYLSGEEVSIESACGNPRRLGGLPE
jgi:hypothetical protein